MVANMTDINEMRMEARECDKRSKELRKKIKEAEEANRLKGLAKFGEIIAEVAGRELDDDDTERFRAYAHGIGKQHILRALNPSSHSAPAQGFPEQHPAEPENHAEHDSRVPQHSESPSESTGNLSK